MSFRTFGENGLLLYGGVGEDEKIGDTDFISISIVNRFIEFAFDLGGGMVVLKSLKQVELGNAYMSTLSKYFHKIHTKFSPNPHKIKKNPHCRN